MAEENNQVRIEIVLDDGSIQKGFANIEKSGKQTAEGLNKSFSLGGLAALAIGLQVANKAYDVFVGSLRDGIKEAIDGEQATLRLGSALKSIAGVTDESVRAFRDFTSSLSAKVAIDDDVINSNAAVLASLGRLSGEGLEKATKAAIDLSTGLNISLETAFRRVALAAEGNVAGLQKIGFQFTKGASDAQILSQALDQINSRFGGLAENKAASTFGGVVSSLKVAFDDANQALGELVTKSPAVREILKFIAEAFRSTTDQLKQFGAEGGLDKLIRSLVSFGGSINTYLIKPLEVFFNLGKVGFDIIDLLIKGVIENIAILGEGLAAVLNAVGVDNQFTKYLQEFGAASQVVTEEAITNFTSLKTVLDTPLSNSLGGSIDELSARISTAKPIVEDFKNSYTTALTSIQKTTVVTADLVKGVLGKGLSSAFQEVGRRLQSGEGLFDDFGNSVVGIIGDLLISIGTALIVQGIAIEAFVTAINSLLPGSGFAAAAAGVGLVIFGSALKASVGKGGGSSAPATGGGGGFSSPADSGGGGFGFSPDDIATADNERKPGQSLVVNVNGDILGDENSGRRLVDLMNAAFDANGVELRQGLV